MREETFKARTFTFRINLKGKHHKSKCLVSFKVKLYKLNNFYCVSQMLVLYLLLWFQTKDYVHYAVTLS